MRRDTQLSASRTTRLPASEARLLKQINQGFAEAWWEHYHELIRRRQESVLTAAENQELIRLTDQVEKKEAKRLQALVQLACLRKQTLTSLMKDLGLPEAADAGRG